MSGRFVFACLLLVALAAPARADDAPVDALPQTAAPASPAPESGAPETAAPKPPAAPAADDASLDALFARLALAKDGDEAAGIVARIDRLNQRSGSDTDDLLLGRAAAALEGQQFDVSLQLLDALVGLSPKWAEAWSERANAHFLAGDPDAAMVDLARALAVDPRHLKALADLGGMFEYAGRRDDALKVYERALAIAPQWGPAREAADRVRAALAGEAL
jgi:tetratricopeptide (TPR) repeat protein